MSTTFLSPSHYISFPLCFPWPHLCNSLSNVRSWSPSSSMMAYTRDPLSLSLGWKQSLVLFVGIAWNWERAGRARASWEAQCFKMGFCRKKTVARGKREWWWWRIIRGLASTVVVVEEMMVPLLGFWEILL